jgi:hypothetical protein
LKRLGEAPYPCGGLSIYHYCMCQIADDFLLCACDEAVLTDPDWILECLDQRRSPLHRRGKALMPRYSVQEQSMQAVVLAGLAHGCFDFDYTPTSGDVLRLRLAEKWYRFRYEQGWQVDQSTSLTGWRAQMMSVQQGTLGNDPSQK